MAEYIDRGEATKAFLREYLENLISVIRSDSPIAEGYKLCIEHAINGLKFVPTADVAEVRHGKWLDGKKNYICSNCKSETGVVKFNYCPNCGAKMDGKDENDG